MALSNAAPMTPVASASNDESTNRSMWLDIGNRETDRAPACNGAEPCRRRPVRDAADDVPSLRRQISCSDAILENPATTGQLLKAHIGAIVTRGVTRVDGHTRFAGAKLLK
jgi:hypothetical protein